LVVAVSAVIATQPAGAQTYHVLHTFKGKRDGAQPQAGLTWDAAGNLYGTTTSGGDTACNHGTGCGTVFKLTTSGKEIVLHRFNGADGKFPKARLIRDTAGNLYGSTSEGGDLNCNQGNGCGTVFRLDTTGKESVLYRFAGGADGAFPKAGLVQDANGNFYGTASGGGNFDGECQSLAVGCGTVFKLDATGKETVLYSFTGNGDGATPLGDLILDTNGSLYGTTYSRGKVGGRCPNRGCGTIFKVEGTGNVTILYVFQGYDGNGPRAGLLQDANGSLFGTTWSGGLGVNGTAFRLDQNGQETVLHNFSGGQGDGVFPDGVLIQDATGNLYGTSFGGWGIVFKLDTANNLTVLYDFSGGAHGAHPEAGLIWDTQGNLYGTAYQGGASNRGVVFRVTP
jgi:uncharacterized repeat protein (TIGR03803 family)